MAQEPRGGGFGHPHQGARGGDFGHPHPGPDPEPADGSGGNTGIVVGRPDYTGCVGVLVRLAIGIGLALGALSIVGGSVEGVIWGRIHVYPVPPAHSQTAAPPRATVSCSGVFTDIRLGESDWSSSELDLVPNVPSTFRVHRFTVERLSTQQLGSGSMRVTHLVFDGVGTFQVLHLQRAGVYDPGACGRASTIDASYSLQNRGDPSVVQAVSFAVRQGGAVYVAGTRPANTSYFDRVDLTGLRETDFVILAGSGPYHPDFSRGKLELGYLTADSCGLGRPLGQPCDETETISALGQWEVTVHR